MIREILHYPNVSLKQTATPVKNLTGDLVQAVEDMVETMYDAPGSWISSGPDRPSATHHCGRY